MSGHRKQAENRSAKKPVVLGYSQPHQFEPLLPRDPSGALAARSAEITARSTALTGKAHPATRARLRELLRSMNSYYSNRIEGQGTHPLNIERALHDDYSNDHGRTVAGSLGQRRANWCVPTK